jgi:DNA (cytosine-5)-methyltransferase 1
MTKNNLKVVSLFAGAGGLDLGFKNSGFDIVWANEYDKEIWETFEKNNPTIPLDRRSITDVPSSDIPDCDGVIGGPPCQSWSAAGTKRGIDDKRGKLFFEFVRILKDKKPKFFLAENVAGMLAERHRPALEGIKELLSEAGYDLHFKLLNAADFDVPQDRKRIIFIGFRKDLNVDFSFPEKSEQAIPLKEVIWDLKDSAVPAQEKNYTNSGSCSVPNHEYFIGGFSSMFMSRNRVRAWDEQSFTIQAGGRHAPLHPQAPPMEHVEKDVKRFVPGKEHLYRRLSVRECARIQTFPDDYIFHYSKLAAAYKMIGNAVPVRFAQALAGKIEESLNKRA